MVSIAKIAQLFRNFHSQNFHSHSSNSSHSSNMSLSGVILFVSTLSRACSASIKYVTDNSIPVQIVKLDTTEARSRAANGKYFQVKSVPTMMVNYDDGNMEVFIGNDKIIPVLSSISGISRSSNNRFAGGGGNTNINYSRPPMEHNMYGPPSAGVKPSKPVYAARPTISRGNIPIIEHDSESDREDEEFRNQYSEQEPKSSHKMGIHKIPILDNGESDEENDTNLQTEMYQEDEELEVPTKKVSKDKSPSKSKSKKAKGKNPKSKAKKKKPPVVFEDNEQDKEIEVEYIDEREMERDMEETITRGGASSKKMKNSRMQGLIDRAKNMEQERLNSLGYNEADLPHYQ